VLESCFRHVIARVIEEVPSARAALFVGGKSMGGRIATYVAAADPKLPLDGLVLLGYPLHPPGKPDQRRDKHLPDIGRPILFVQGTRDTFGTPAELAPVIDAIGASALHVVDGGDHSFKISKKDPAAQTAVYERVQRAMLAWMKAIVAAKLHGVPMFYWLAYPHGEASLYAAQTGVARYRLLYSLRGALQRLVLYRIIMPACTHVFVQSEQMRRDVAREGIPLDRMTAVPSSVNLRDLDARAGPADDGRSLGGSGGS